MALIEVKGYVNKPSTFAEGKHSRFTLAERQLHGKEKTPVKVYYDVTQWNTAEPPKESSFISIKGFLNVEKVEKEGRSFTNLRISATAVDVIGLPTNDGGNKEGPAKKAEEKKTPGAPEEDFSDLPF